MHHIDGIVQSHKRRRKLQIICRFNPHFCFHWMHSRTVAYNEVDIGAHCPKKVRFAMRGYWLYNWLFVDYIRTFIIQLIYTRTQASKQSKFVARRQLAEPSSQHSPTLPRRTARTRIDILRCITSIITNLRFWFIPAPARRATQSKLWLLLAALRLVHSN